MPIPLKVSVSGTLSTRLKQRAQAWSAARIGAKITVPPELKWWYWQEFGTASRGEVGGSSYPIKPVVATELRFPEGGKIQFRSEVNHPGIRARRSVTKALTEIRYVIADNVPAAFGEGALDDPAILQTHIMDATNQAKTLIVASIAENIPGLRDVEPEQGRLGGITAAEAFDAGAQVVEMV